MRSYIHIAASGGLESVLPLPLVCSTSPADAAIREVKEETGVDTGAYVLANLCSVFSQRGIDAVILASRPRV